MEQIPDDDDLTLWQMVERIYTKFVVEADERRQEHRDRMAEMATLIEAQRELTRRMQEMNDERRQ